MLGETAGNEERGQLQETERTEREVKLIPDGVCEVQKARKGNENDESRGGGNMDAGKAAGNEKRTTTVD